MFHFAVPAPPDDGLDTFTCRAGMRLYRLAPPPGSAADIRGLVLLLHGCGQRAARFGPASGMEAQAARHGWLTLTPQQTRRKNVLGCWNWFLPEHRARRGGEAEILAQLTCSVAAAHGVPPGAVFVAGFSAGGAMALALADAWPDLFAAACIHSGLHYAGITDSDRAAAAMRGTFAQPLPEPRDGRVPVLVMQGEADPVVHPANARRITDGRGRRDRLVMLPGGGHDWAPGAAAEAVRFFRRHDSTRESARAARLRPA